MEIYPDYLLLPFQIINDEYIEPIAEKLYGIVYWYSSMSMRKCYASNAQLAKLLKTSPRTIQNSLDSLEKRGYIKRIYKDSSRRHRKEIIPTVTFKSQSETAVTPDKQSEAQVTLDSNRGDQNNNSNKEYRNTAQGADGFSLEREIKKLEESDRRDLNIIALYFEERRPDLQNKDQFQIALKQHLRSAGSLRCFTNDQILKGVEKAKRQTPEWVLGTVVKMLTK